MTSIPTNFTVPAVVSSMASIDNAENTERLAKVEALGNVILSDDPKVTIDEKLAAYTSLGSLGSTGWRAAGAREAVTKAYWLATESPLAKKIQDVGTRYQDAGMAEGRAAQARGGDEAWTGANPIAAFSKFSDDDQKVLMVALGLNTKYGSVKDAYDDFQRQSDEAVARYQAGREAKSDAVTLSDQAKALLGPEGVAKVTGSAGEQALAALKAGVSQTAEGSVALRMLQKAAEARADARAEDEKSQAKATATPPESKSAELRASGSGALRYQAGAVLDTSA